MGDFPSPLSYRARSGPTATVVVGTTTTSAPRPTTFTTASEVSSCTADCTTFDKNDTGIIFTSDQVTGPVPKTCSVVKDPVEGWPIITCASLTYLPDGPSCTIVPTPGDYVDVYVTVACPPLWEHRALSGKPLPTLTEAVVVGASSWMSTFVTEDPVVVSRSLALLPSSIHPPPANPAPTTSVPTASATQGSGNGGSAHVKNNANKIIAAVVTPIAFLTVILLIYGPGRKWWLKKHRPLYEASRLYEESRLGNRQDEDDVVRPSLELAEYNGGRIPRNGGPDPLGPALSSQEYDRPKM
ncbi:hypothetical protein FKW77_003826 [Venturia effusa]|uniref:Uncharacterized protein n=1 Tax=Venturia effusa TaxID=50376 RepID=A0A517LR52_9PEZI|nr:hypothetical protein FKW77_003826 [Venturia effusa]